ncbi:hypothetical protein [Candidatus Magnetominusculus dajiuhuensis]
MNKIVSQKDFLSPWSAFLASSLTLSCSLLMIVSSLALAASLRF